jgi:flagellar motility protein MotE (MotC chaperone)
MEVRINGKAADITLDHEKTVGQIVAGLDNFLANCGHRLSGLAIDGKTVDISSMEDAFSKEINNVNIVDLYTRSLAELFALTLLELLGDIEEYESLNFENKNKFHENWKESACARFAEEQMPELFSLCVNAFCGRGMDILVLRSITEERLREVREPAQEIANMQSSIEETCARLVDLPLDIQTGKDRRAAETIQIFTGITEKIFRILVQLDIQGFMQNTEKEKAVQLLGGFNLAVRELLQAYEKQDTVLVGDLAEYEIAPKLGELFNAITESSRKAAGI